MNVPPETVVTANESDDDDNDDHEIDYNLMPKEISDLDDNEFKSFLILRQWRRDYCEAKGIDEPYKVFQNRTLCEFIRRRRNDPHFATIKSNYTIREDLLSVWGIGKQQSIQRTLHTLLNVVFDLFDCRSHEGSICRWHCVFDVISFKL